MTKVLKFGSEARDKIRYGVDQLANAVSATMGPKGRNVVISKPYGPPVITKDGVTVAREIEVTDEFVNQGIRLIKEAAQKTADDAGDGTTTSTVIARAIYVEGLKLISAGHDPMSIKRGIDKATRQVIDKLNELSSPVSSQEDIINVGTISSNNDRSIGEIIALAMDRVGTNGVITVEEQVRGTETSLSVVEGMQFDRGYIVPYFITNAETMSAEYKQAYFLLHDGPISTMKHLVSLMNEVNSQAQALGRQTPLVIVADNIEGEALSLLVTNKMRGIFPSVAIKAPYYGDKKKEFLQDLAALTGATLISSDTGRTIKEVSIQDLGIAESVIVTKETTTIVGGKGQPSSIEERVSQINFELENGSPYDTEFLQERLAKLTSGVAVIYAGGNNQVEIQEKKDRIDDALAAVKAAVAEGIVPGGGVALLRAGEVLDTLETPGEEPYGVKIVKKALETPLATILRNAGVSSDVIINSVKENEDYRVGYNALTDQFENLLKAGVIDPTKVVRSALENASSIAGLMLTTEVLIVDDPDVVKNSKET